MSKTKWCQRPTEYSKNNKEITETVSVLILVLIKNIHTHITFW